MKTTTIICLYLSFKSLLNKFILLEFIKRQESKIAKQSRNNKKILKRFKQIRINVIDNKDLDVLQNILIDYFKNRTLLTKNLLRQKSLLKKINNICKKYLTKYITKVSKLRYYIKKLLHKYYKNMFIFNKLICLKI